MGNSFVLFDVSIVISHGQFHCGDRGHTQNTDFPWVKSHFPVGKRSSGTTANVRYHAMFQYRFDPQTGAWEHKQFKKEEGEALFSLHDISYNEAGMVINNSITCRDFKGTLDVSIYP